MLIKDVRMKATEEDIKNILGRMGIQPVLETEQAIIYPTYCHNHTPKEGSNKLYYYKDEKIFKCYTGCSKQFDIFEMIIKVKTLRGEEYGLRQAMDFANLGRTGDFAKEIYDDLAYLSNMNKNTRVESEEIVLRDPRIVDEYPFDAVGTKSWQEEGISPDAMKKFRIGYHPFMNGITIPTFDASGDFVGMRIRFLNPDSKVKYMPLKHIDEILSFPTGKFLYGLYQNKETIQRVGKVIIFEGEKSVLKMESFFPGMNFSVATFGKRITFDHLNLIMKLGINEVILAYDKEYRNNGEFQEVFKEYSNMMTIFKGFMNISVVMDHQNWLDYKDSPADQGKEILEKLLNNRERL